MGKKDVNMISINDKYKNILKTNIDKIRNIEKEVVKSGRQDIRDL